MINLYSFINIATGDGGFQAQRQYMVVLLPIEMQGKMYSLVSQVLIKEQIMRPFKVELFGYFYTLELYNEQGREVFDADEAVIVAEALYSGEWLSVFNGSESRINEKRSA
jgi:hypothetical protein